MSYVYECAISAVTAEGSVEIDEELDDLPVGWTRVMLQRRVPNPEWLAIQHVKEATINGYLLQIPEEARVAQRPFVALQVAAQFKALENATAPFLIDVSDVFYVSESDEVAEEWNNVRESMGLAKVPPFSEVMRQMFPQAAQGDTDSESE